MEYTSPHDKQILRTVIGRCGVSSLYAYYKGYGENVDQYVQQDACPNGAALFIAPAKSKGGREIVEKINEQRPAEAGENTAPYAVEGKDEPKVIRCGA